MALTRGSWDVAEAFEFAAGAAGVRPGGVIAKQVARANVDVSVQCACSCERASSDGIRNREVLSCSTYCCHGCRLYGGHGAGYGGLTN